MAAFDPLSRVLGGLAALLGGVAVCVYAAAGLTLSHYDAKAHLVVARRILDSLTPSWEQIGAVWLPLPHVLNALPVQIDLLYRTGAAAIVLSVLSCALAAACLAALVVRLTGSRAGGALAALLFAANPSILYLQSTPMTEPLLFGLTTLAVLLLTEWAQSDTRDTPRAAGWAIVGACLTRYEAWPVVAAAMGLAAWVRWRRGTALSELTPMVARIAMYPAAALVAFLLLSRITIGEWFVTGGFYVPDPQLAGRPGLVAEAIVTGAAALGGWRLVELGGLASVALVIAALSQGGRSALVMPLSLAASAALPFYAYVSGHPFRTRYQVPVILALAATTGAGVGLLRRLAPGAALAIAAAVMLQSPPFERDGPMLREAQLDRVNSQGRRAVTACLSASYDGTTIMASMGSLAHYMQELSNEGFGIADFLHEGNGPLWVMALSRGPAPLAGWVLVEEVAEGGDVLFERQRAFPGFLTGFDRVCEGGNTALYRRGALPTVPRE